MPKLAKSVVVNLVVKLLVANVCDDETGCESSSYTSLFNISVNSLSYNSLPKSNFLFKFVLTHTRPKT